MPGTQAPQWLLVYSQPNREFVAEDFLTKFGFIAYLPKIQGKTRVQPFLSRYLFARSGTGRRSLDFIPGVASFVKTASQEPIYIGQAVIDTLQEREDGSGFITLTGRVAEQPYAPNERVRVVDQNGFDMWDGLFKEMSGTHRAVLFVSGIGLNNFEWRITTPVSRLRKFDGNSR